MESFGLIVLLLLMVVWTVFAAGANRNAPSNRKSNAAATGQDMYKEIDTLLKSWNRIGRRICSEERLSEKKNDQIYNCLRDESDMQTVSGACDFDLLNGNRLF